MGKKRQKIQWFPVETLQWAGDEEKEYQIAESAELDESGVRLAKVVGSGRNTSLGPRFERRLLPGSEIAAPCNAGTETKHVYYDGELREAETLPNGFTKIRSKNLDILFKREYYEQRLATQKQLSEELKKAEAEKTPPETGSESCNDTEIISEKDPKDAMDKAEPVEHKS